MVLQIIETVGGGAGRACVDVAAATVAAGGGGLVVSNGGPLLGELQRLGGVSFNAPVSARGWLTRRATCRRLRALVASQRVDLLHAHDDASLALAATVATAMGVPLVLTVHRPLGPLAAAGGWAMLPGRSSASSKPPDRLIAISETLAADLAARWAAHSDVEVIEPGVDFTVFSPDAVSPERVMGLVSRWRLPHTAAIITVLTDGTDVEDTIAVLDALKRSVGHAYRVLLVGAEALSTAHHRLVERAVADFGLAAAVQPTEPCEDLPALFKLSSLVIALESGTDEAIRTMVAAQGMGRPCIAATDAVPESVIDHGRAGWRVERRDAQAIAATVSDALAMDTAQRAAFAAHSGAFARAYFDREQMTAATLAVYHRLLTADHYRTGSDGQSGSTVQPVPAGDAVAAGPSLPAYHRHGQDGF